MEETPFQFFIRANGGTLIFVLRLVVGVLIPALVAMRPPHGPLIDFVFGALIMGNVLMFQLAHMKALLNKSMAETDESLKLLDEINTENLKLRNAMSGAFIPLSAPNTKGANDKAN
jgi:hypothetical protein